MIRLLLALPLLLGVPSFAPPAGATEGRQDPPIVALVQQLDSASLEDRESAFEQLVRVGAPAVSALKAALDANPGEELRQQIRRTLTAIDDRAAMEKACPPSPVIAIDREGTIRELADAIAATAKRKFEYADAGVTAKIALKIDGVPLFEALDRLCAGRDDCSWEQPEGGVIRFLRDRHPACPTVYAGSFRVRLTSLIAERESDFKKPVQHVSFQLTPDFDRALQPMSKWSLEVTEVVDDADRKWTILPDRHAVGAGVPPVQVRMAMGMPQQSGSSLWFHADDLDLATKAIKTLKGVAIWRFPFNAQAVTLDDLASGATKQVSGFDVGIRSQQRNMWLLTFSKKEAADNLPAEIQDRLDLGSVMMVDDEGKETKPDSTYAQNSPVRFVAVGGKGARPVPASDVSYRITFNPGEGRTVKGLKFRFVDRTFERKVPFEFSNLQLP